jgi:hypothetical protein
MGPPGCLMVRDATPSPFSGHGGLLTMRDWENLTLKEARKRRLEGCRPLTPKTPGNIAQKAGLARVRRPFFII